MKRWRNDHISKVGGNKTTCLHMNKQQRATGSYFFNNNKMFLSYNSCDEPTEHLAALQHEWANMAIICRGDDNAEMPPQCTFSD